MKKHTLLITRPIPSEGLALLRKDKRLTIDLYSQDKPIPRAELLKRAKGKDFILSILTDKIDAAVFQAAGPSLKMVANYAVGFDNIDLAEAAKRNIIVSNTPSELVNESVAEHTVALLFALAHRVVEADAFTRAGKYKAWGPSLLLGTDVFGKTIGIVGSGRIGAGVVKRLHSGFGMNVVYTDVQPNHLLEKQTRARRMPLSDLLRVSDFVSLHVPLLKSTHHLIGAKELKKMKKTAFLINTARGPIVDSHALINALTKKHIAGAGLDVFEGEPLIATTKKDIALLRAMPNVVLTPHTASATQETRQEMSRIAAHNILALLDGRRPPNAVT